MARITKSNLAKKTTLPDLPDSNSLSRRRARRPRVIAATPLPRPPPPSSYRSQSTQTDEPALNNNRGPRVFHSERERVDSILEQLHEHRWSFATFIKHYVTASGPSNYDTPERRANRLWKAIFEEPEVEERLMVHGDCRLGRLHQEPLCKQIEQELEDLMRPREENGVIIPGRLGRFDAKEPVEKLELSTITADVQRLAPTLWSFLIALVKQRPYANSRDITPYHNKLFMVCAILANVRAPQASFQFHAALGVHLHNIGVKRRCIALLHELGVTISYTGLAKIRKELEEAGRVCASTLEGLDETPPPLRAEGIIEASQL